MRELLILVSALTLHPHAAALDNTLHAKTVITSQLVSSTLIVGRTTCVGRAWLLTETLQLVEVGVGPLTTAVRAVDGFLPDDRPWGLACTADGSLWTLASPHVIARLTREGRIVDRLEFKLPRIALFASNDRLVFQQLPAAAGQPLLQWSDRRTPFAVHFWSGPVARAGSSTADALVANLFNCGLGIDGRLPCWFPDESLIVISDGTASSARQISAGRRGVDPTAPIWDVALAPNATTWTLLTAERSVDGRRAAAYVVRERADRRVSELHLDRPARLILWATETTCVLLGATGELIEVVAR